MFILGSRLLKNHAISKIKTRQGLLYFLGLSFVFIVGLVWPWAHSFLICLLGGDLFDSLYKAWEGSYTQD